MPNQALERLKQRVSNNSRKFDLMYWADIFMNEYGMNFEDFKKLNIPAFYLLRNKMQKRYDEINKRNKRKGRK